MLLIRCLGSVRVSHKSGDTSLAPAQRRILAILAAAGLNGLSSEEIAEELYFNEAIPNKWNGAFRKAMNRLRRVVDVVYENGRYQIDQSTHEVDLWQLRHVDMLDLDHIVELQLQYLLTGDPFPGIALSPRLTSAIEEVASLRVELVQRMLATNRTDWSAQTLHVIRTLTAREHYRESLLAAVTQLHIRAGDMSTAHQLVDTASEYLESELDVALDPAIVSLVSAGHSAPPSLQVSTIDGRIVGASVTLNGLSSVPRSSLARQVNEALADGGVLLSGESGAGKTALLQRLINEWSSSGNHVLWVTGRRGTSAAYAPILAVVPSLEDDLAPLFDRQSDELLQTKCWTAARRRLATEFAGLPLTLVVDDAQWLDSHTQGLVGFLASSAVDPPLRLVVAGRSSEAPTSWELFANGLARVGLNTIHIGDFSVEELVELTGIHHPSSTSKQRRDLAYALIDRKATLPLIAQELVGSAAPETLILVPYNFASPQQDIWSTRVDESTQRIAAMAAVLGTQFRIADLAALGDYDLEQVVQATDELQEADVLISEQRPDEFSFRHVLIHREFDSLLDRGERRRLHLDAAKLADSTGAVHKHAAHIVEAGALLANAEVVEAVLASARAFQIEGSYREAVVAFTEARSISDHEISPRDLVLFAAAIAGSGGDSWDVRSLAFEHAQNSGDQEMSLEIALAGVRRTEDSMGDHRRIDMLDRIDASQLSETLQVAHASALSRELGLLGLNERALEASSQAVRLATTPTTRLTAWLGGWAACRSIPPAEWPPLPDDRGAVTDHDLVAPLALIECAQALVRGDDHLARSTHQRIVSQLLPQMNPLRRWHTSLATALFAFVDGDWEGHDAEANAAVEAASLHGVNAAFSTRAAQLFVQRWVAGRHLELLPFLEAAPPDLQNSFLSQAALAVTLAEVPERSSEASRIIEHVAQRAGELRSPFSHPAAGLLASAPQALMTTSVRQQLRGVLEPFDGTALAVGAGISHLGPVSWSLANLTTEPAERIALLQRSIDEADRWRLKLWSVRCRVDLATTSGDEGALNEARRIAQGTNLTELLPD